MVANGAEYCRPRMCHNRLSYLQRVFDRIQEVGCWFLGGMVMARVM